MHTYAICTKLLYRLKKKYRNHAPFEMIFITLCCHVFQVNLEIAPEALSAIAQQAMEKKTGARGLRAIMERILLEPMFEVPGTDVTDVIITENVVKENQAATYVTRSEGDDNADTINATAGEGKEEDGESNNQPQYQEVRNN